MLLKKNKLTKFQITLQAALAEGYKDNHKENEQLINEFSQADLENWYDY